MFPSALHILDLVTLKLITFAYGQVLKQQTFIYFTLNWSEIQSPLGFATRGLAAALALATATPLTDLRQYINSDHGFSDLKICFL